MKLDHINKHFSTPRIHHLLIMILVQLQMYIGSQLTPKQSIIFMQLALGFGKEAELNVLSIEHLLFVITGFHFMKKFLI